MTSAYTIGTRSNMLTVQCESLKWTQTQRKSEPCSSFLLYLSVFTSKYQMRGKKKKLGQAFFQKRDGQAE